MPGASGCDNTPTLFRLQDPAHSIWGGRDDPQIGFGGTVGSAGALFPIAQGPQRDLKLLRKLALREPQSLTNLLRIGNASHPCQLLVGERRVVWVSKRVLESLFSGQRFDERPVLFA